MGTETPALNHEQTLALYEQIVPHLEAIERLFKVSRITLLVRAPQLPNGDLLLTQDDEATIIEAIKRQMAKRPAVERDADDDRIFALLCARKDARTDDDAAAIAWAEDEIADLRKDRASVVELANKHVAEIERLRAELEKARDGMQNALADAIKDAISDLDDHAGDDLPTRRFLAGAIDGLKKALFIAVSASPVPQNGESGE